MKTFFAILYIVGSLGWLIGGYDIISILLERSEYVSSVLVVLAFVYQALILFNISLDYMQEDY